MLDKLAEQRTTGLSTLKCHLSHHIVENICRSGRLPFLNTSLVEHYTGFLKNMGYNWIVIKSHSEMTSKEVLSNALSMTWTDFNLISSVFYLTPQVSHTCKQSIFKLYRTLLGIFWLTIIIAVVTFRSLGLMHTQMSNSLDRSQHLRKNWVKLGDLAGQPIRQYLPINQLRYDSCKRKQMARMLWGEARRCQRTAFCCNFWASNQ